jgi:CheY-like chemotaxis protein
MVLIVDDNQDEVVIMKRILSRIGRDIRVEAALGGNEALSFLRSGRELPSLVLLDLKMPGLDGFDLLSAMREDARTKDIPVVVVSSSSLEYDEKRSLASGAVGFIHKALDMDKFREDITHLLNRWLKK